MSVEYPSDYPRTRRERMKALLALKDLRDEDIDCSDMPELTEEDFARGTRVGDRFIKMGERNLAILNVLLSDHERVAAAARASGKRPTLPSDTADRPDATLPAGPCLPGRLAASIQ